MPNSCFWQSSTGLALLDKIIAKRVPSWSTGLREGQKEAIVKVLDDEDVFWIAATGDGKSAAFQVPLLVHDEISQNPDLYPGINGRPKAVGVVIMPTKGLGCNIVTECQNLGISAFAYTHANVTQARKDNVDLVAQISCCEYSLVLVDPEHLKKSEWVRIARSPIFCSNLIYACAEDAHLIDKWGNPDFRPDFKYIGTYFRSRLPSSKSVIALSATVEPGNSTTAICQSLGFKHPFFHMLRGSNERPNTQFILEPLTHGAKGKVFPQLLPYLSTGRKTVIHCQDLETVYQVYVYLMQYLDGTNPDSLRRMRVYHSLCSDKYNKETQHLLKTDPLCQVGIATVALANGINVPSLLTSISIGTSQTFNQTWQEKGRVGRDPETIAQGVLLASPKKIAEAEKYIEACNKSLPPPHEMDLANALVLTEKICHIACINRIYQNPPVELTMPKPPPTSNTSKRWTLRDLKKEEREKLEPLLIQFGESVWRTESLNSPHQFLPKSSYFSTTIRNRLLDDFMHIVLLEYLTNHILEPNHWPFIESHGSTLYNLILSELIVIQGQRFRAHAQNKRKQKANKKWKEWEGSSDRDEVYSEEEVSESELLPSPTAPKRSALESLDVTNSPRP
ncbi:hypothetical protein BT96DRAFT_998899 [Gymnopus androsaceus JB14]|uniref:DNA 3'-5' helicase n=1 Tax=Gymnopus androsaceus JB14 TaxID=1447944 RepID=A0A6A4H763_9AGAR|nr:hypothetical protein BT96DRAFT_998899 [Gymnopus androsaceus JB14]